MSDILLVAIGGSAGTSDLYSVDLSTGVMTSIGAIGFALTGLALDPTSGILYGITTPNSVAHPRSIVTVDPLTGAGTFVATLTGLSGSNLLADISIDSSGQMYGIYTGSGTLIRVNKATGACTFVGSQGSNWAGGLDFDAVGACWQIGGIASKVSTVNTITGVRTDHADFGSSDRLTSGKFDSSGVFWGSLQHSPTSVDLVTVNLSTGAIITIASYSVALNIDAMEFIAGASANFSSVASPSNITTDPGTSVTSTITLSLTSGPNDTAAFSTGTLPSGITVSFSPASASESGGTTVATITVGAGVGAGTYNITIHATDSDETVDVVITINVNLTNTDCAHATPLIGESGTASGNNTAWAGVWPTGADPLYNANGRGGGAPLWWKWTNTTGQRVLFQYQVTSAPAAYNAGIAIGVCGSLDMSADPFDLSMVNAEGGNVNHRYADWDFSSGFHATFDIVVDPGHTVFIELDSYVAGSFSEPPTVPGGSRGVFTFTWGAHTYTTRDSTEGDGKSTFSTLLHDTFAPIDGAHNPFGNIKPYQTLIVDNRIYMIWKATEQYGDSIYVGDCALDGSGLSTQRIFEATGPGATPYPTNDIPRIFTDGTNVFATYGSWIEVGSASSSSGVGYTGGGSSYPNPDFPDSCAAHAGSYTFCFGEGDGTTVDTFRYDIWRFIGSGTWTLLKSIGQDHDKTVGFVPNAAHALIDAIDSDMVARAHVVSGVVWVQAAYYVTRAFQSFHANDYPLAGTPPGSIYLTNDHVDLYEYADTYTVALDGTCTLVNRVENHVAELQHWVSEDHTINPAFSSWQVFADGNFYTDPNPSTHYTSIRYHPTACELRCDEGYPILAYSPQAYVYNNGRTVGGAFTDNTVKLTRPNTGATLATYTYGDMAVGYAANTNVYCWLLTLGPKFIDPLDSISKRILSTQWQVSSGIGPSFVKWTDKIPSNASGAPEYIVPGDTFSSTVGPTGTLFPDIDKSQWWKIDDTTIHQIDLYEFCDNAWQQTYLSTHVADGVPASPPSNSNIHNISMRSADIFTGANTSYFYLINDANQLRRIKVLRDFYICSVGAIVTPGCPPSVLWFFVDGQWRQQNVDTTFSLWYFQDGAWHQDCQELQGQLQGSWQT